MNETLPFDLLKQQLASIPNLRDRALFCTQYLACARVGEIVRPYNYNRDDPVLGVLKQDVCREEIAGREFFVIYLRTEKNPVQRHRRVPVNIELNIELIEAIEEYLEIAGNELFPITTRYARILCKKYLGFNTHTLRHNRTTHLLQGKGVKKPLKDSVVQKIGGWKWRSSLDRYDHTVVEDYIEDI